MKTIIGLIAICILFTVVTNSCDNLSQESQNRNVSLSADLATSNTSLSGSFFEGEIPVGTIISLLNLPTTNPTAGVCFFRDNRDDNGVVRAYEKLRVIKVGWNGNDNFDFAKQDGSTYPRIPESYDATTRRQTQQSPLKDQPEVNTSSTEIPVALGAIRPDFDFVFFDEATMRYLCNYYFKIKAPSSGITLPRRMNATHIKLTRIVVNASEYGKYFTLRACTVPDPLKDNVVAGQLTNQDAIAFGIGFACPPGWLLDESVTTNTKNKNNRRDFQHGQLIYTRTDSLGSRFNLTLDKLGKAIMVAGLIPKL